MVTKSEDHPQSKPLLALLLHHDRTGQHLQQPHVQFVVVILQFPVLVIETISGTVEHIKDFVGVRQIVEKLGRFGIIANLAYAEFDRSRRIVMGFEPPLTLGDLVLEGTRRIVGGVTISDYTNEQRLRKFACLDFVIYERLQYTTAKCGAELRTALERCILQGIGKLLLGRNHVYLPRIVDEADADGMIIRRNLGSDLGHAANKISLYPETIFETHRCAVVAIEDGMIES